MRLMIALALAFCAGTLQAAGLGWRVADADGGTAYLVGTIHAARESLYPLPDPINQAFARAEVLVVEVDIGAVDPRAAQRVSAEHGMFPRDGSLRALLADDVWTRAAAWGERLGVPARTLDRMRPWLAAVTLVSLEIRRLGLDPDFGIERYFASQARVRSMPIVELESLSEQLTTLAALPPAAQVAFLAGSIPTGDDFRESAERIVNSWRDGDVDTMTAVLEESYTEPVIYDALMRDRNNRWLPEIEAMLGSGRVHFVAVGALHLVGDDGLVTLLEKRGYRVERL